MPPTKPSVSVLVPSENSALETLTPLPSRSSRDSLARTMSSNTIAGTVSVRSSAGLGVTVMIIGVDSQCPRDGPHPQPLSHCDGRGEQNFPLACCSGRGVPPQRRGESRSLRSRRCAIRPARQRPLVKEIGAGVLGRQLLIEVDPQARFVIRVHKTIAHFGAAGEHLVQDIREDICLLNTKVR